MRFPRLSNLFHRRVRSDPDLNRLASTPMTMPTQRANSSTCIVSLTPPDSASSDIFASFVPAAPYTPVRSNTLNHHHSFPTSTNYFHDVFDSFTQRIRDLELALQAERRVTSIIPALETALVAERAEREASQEANNGLIDDVTALQNDVLQLRRELFTTALAAQEAPMSMSASASSGQVHLEALAAENAALHAERARLRRFIELMVSAGGHRPVVDDAYHQVVQGEEPEAALVMAIKAEAQKPESVWRALLEPVTGVRTQEEYLAQLRCTLAARGQTYDWRKRAKFWKRTAQEDGKHASTVTPSVSALSDIVDTLPADRQQKAEEMVERVRNGTQSLRVARASVVVVPSLQDTTVTASSSIPPTGPTELESIVELNETSGELDPADIPLPASCSSMVLPTVLPSASTIPIPSIYTNLPPLASETFRASHSISTLSSRRSSRSSRSTPGLQLPYLNTTRSSMNIGRLSTSISASTQGSARSQHRRAQLFGESSPSLAPDASPPTRSSSAKWSLRGLSHSVSSLVSNLSIRRSPKFIGAAPSPAASPASAAPSSHDLPSASSSADIAAVRAASPSPSPSPSSSPTPAPAPSSDKADTTDSSLVLVELADASFRTPPTSPERKSRLPVRAKARKAVRRLSAQLMISRPVLVDSTNAAFVPPAARKAPAAATAKGGSRIPAAAPRRLPAFGWGVGRARP